MDIDQLQDRSGHVELEKDLKELFYIMKKAVTEQLVVITLASIKG